MNKINFENLPSTNTPINSSNLNQMQTNVENEFANKYNLTRGTVIPNNSDLNNFTTLGSFYCESPSKAQSLSNCPVTTAFKLIVENIASSEQYRQTIYGQGTSSQTWIRTYNGTNWGNWRIVSYDTHLTDEIMIGSWINKKPIYRRVLEYTTLSANGYYDIITTGIDTITQLDAFVKRKDYAFINTIPGRTHDSSYYVDIGNIELSSHRMKIEFGSGWTQSMIDKIYIIIEYTKTTD